MSTNILPGMPEPSPAFERPKRSAGQRMTERQAQDVRQGRHPLTGGRLHDRADTTARKSDPTGLSYRCGSCTHRVSLNHHGEHWPKCDLSTITHGQASDCRAWWPACPRWEATT
jgi:hypothetical protein